MNNYPNSDPTATDELQALRQENARLAQRVATLEAAAAHQPSQAQALQERLRLMEHLGEATDVRLYYFDAGLVCRYVNGAFEKAWNLPRTSALNRHLHEFAAPAFIAAIEPRLRQVLSGESLRFEYESSLRQGRQFHRVSMTPDWHEGRVVGVVFSAHEVTDLHEAELASREKHRLLQSIADNVPVLIGYYDRHTVCRFANRQFEAWYGVPPEVAVGRPLQASLPDKVYQSVQARIQRALQGESVHLEGRHLDPDGHERYISGWYIPDRRGEEVVGFFATFTDITDRRKAETALLTSQQFLHSITDNMPGLIGYYDAGLVCRFANRQYEHFYGLPAASVVGRHIRDMVPPEAYPVALPRIEGVLRGEPQDFEAADQQADGELRHVHASYTPDLQDGQVRGFFVRIDDITERKKTEAQIMELNRDLEQRIRQRSLALYESEERYRMMAEGMQGSALYFLTPEGKVSSWTRSAQRLTGYASKEVLGRHFSMFFLAEGNADQAREACDQLLVTARDMGQIENRAWRVRKDGSRFFAMSVINPLLDSHGQLRGYSKLVRDISDIRQAQDLMRNLNTELEARVKTRTSQLEAANRELESFSYSVSHDLRSPLRHIVGNIELLRMHLDGHLDPDTQRMLGTISESAKRMGQLIDGLLAFARMGRAAIKPVPVKFNAMVQAVRAAVMHTETGRQIEWSVDDLPEVEGDPLLLQEVWTNLLDNAVKYTRRQARAHIVVRWHAVTDPQDGYVFEVADNGVGFDPKHASKLFGMFQRLHHAHEFEGTGIGLAMIQRIVARHGGRVWAESTPGAGSRFYFMLPKTLPPPESP